MDSKRLRNFSLKANDRGQVEAIFSTFGLVDLDGDITVRSAFEDGAPVLISAYGHASWRGELPVGKGTIRTTATDARLHGRFFMDTDAGREAYGTVKSTGALQEWSYGFDVLAESEPTAEQRKRGARRVLRSLKVHEVSPVFRGASVDTRTVAIKHSDAAAAAVRAARASLAESERALAELKRLERRPPSPEHGLAAAFTADVARKILYLDQAPAIKWRPMDAMGETFTYDRQNIYLSPDLSLGEIPEVVLHEAMHLDQWLIQSPEAREKEAREFGRKWAHPVFQAGRASGWNPSRVRITDRRPPLAGAAPGTVAIERKSARAWDFDPRRRGPAWREI